ncbi:hypothetical protein F5Y11DRAFT_366050 [Daldinia sp. FL1419]|nr:hypothetical protein F5Y11DRAFT_366050 [Daldinia sp. FL1419]
MLSTWKPGAETEDHHLPEQPYTDPTTSKQGRQPACNHCREKKLGCSRDRPRCKRCQQSGISCVYRDKNKHKIANMAVSDGLTFHLPAYPGEPASFLMSYQSSYTYPTSIITPTLTNQYSIDTIPMTAYPISPHPTDTSGPDIKNTEGINGLGVSWSQPGLLQQMPQTLPLQTPVPSDMGDGIVESPELPVIKSEDTDSYSSSESPLLSNFDVKETFNTKDYTNETLYCPQVLHRHRITAALADVHEIAAGIDNVDDALHTIKNALDHGKDVSGCAACLLDSETVELLIALMESLARSCENIAISSRVLSITADEKQMDIPKLLLGKYRVDRFAEFQPMLLGLLRIQVQEIELVSNPSEFLCLSRSSITHSIAHNTVQATVANY